MLTRKIPKRPPGRAAKPLVLLAGARLPFRNVLLAGVMMACMGFEAGCERQRPPATMADVRAEAGPSQESWNVRFAVSEAGRPRLEINAGYMAQYERPDSTFTLMEAAAGDSGRVRVLLFDEATGDTAAAVDADRLYYYDAERRFEARGDVRVLARGGRRLAGEHLRWNEAERKIRTPHFVRITTENETVQGYELVADEDLETYSLARITGQVTIEQEDPPGGEAAGPAPDGEER